MRTRVSWTLAILLLLICLVIAAVAPGLAQSGNGYDLSWSRIAGGGIGPATGNSFSLDATAGQPDAGKLQGGSFELQGGFWHSTTNVVNSYLPLVLRQP